MSGKDDLLEEYDTDNDDDIRSLSQKANVLSPFKKNIFLQGNYWALCSKAARKMKWDATELEQRCVENTLFKSKDCNKAKTMQATITQVDISQVKIGSPEAIENEEQLKLVKLVHQKIMSREKQKKTTRSLLKLPRPSVSNDPKQGDK